MVFYFRLGTLKVKTIVDRFTVNGSILKYIVLLL
jgi:hypothetical protein